MREAHAYRGRVGAHQSALTAPTDFLLGDWIVDQSVMDKMCFLSTARSQNLRSCC